MFISLIALFIIISACYLIVARAEKKELHPPTRPPADREWEYHALRRPLSMNDRKWARLKDEWGSDGWEIVGHPFLNLVNFRRRI